MRPFALLLPLLFVAGDVVPPSDRTAASSSPPPLAPALPADATAALRQTQFVPNLGQWSESVRYAVFGDTMGWLHDDGYSLQLERAMARECELSASAPERVGCVVRTRFLAAATPEFVAGASLATRRNFLIGSPDRWRRDVSSWDRVTMRGVHPGIDVVFRPLPAGRPGLCEYDLVLAPGADLGDFVARCEGVDELSIDRAGRLCARVHDGVSSYDLVQEAPVAWQETPAGPRPLQVTFRLLDRTTYGFEAPDLDAAQVAVVDPGVVWGTFLGGGSSDRINSMRWREGVGVWVAGWAGSTDLPTTVGAFRTVGGADGFVARITDTGASLVYATYLGGSGNEEIRGLDLGPGDTPVVVGFTQSTNFPVTPGALQPTFRGSSPFLEIGDGFVASLDATGSSLLASSYLGGVFDDVAEAVHVDTNGTFTVAGWTSSGDFPVSATAPQPVLAGLAGASSDGFVVRLSPTLQTLVTGTFNGGFLNDHFVAVDRDPVTGDAVAAGWTSSIDFPTTPNVVRPTFGGLVDGIVTRINATGTAFVFATYLGAAEFDYTYATKFGANGTIWVGGTTDSPTYPVTLNAPQLTPGGSKDGILTQLSANGQTIVYSTLLGGAGPDRVRALDVASNGIVVVGEAGDGFPVTANAVQSTFGAGMLDGFLVWLTNGGSTIAFSSYFGGAGQDILASVDLSDSGVVVLAGRTFSSDFPIAPAGYQSQLFGAEDGVVLQLDLLSALGDSLEVIAESSAAPRVVEPGEHELLAARLQNLTARGLVVDEFRLLIAGAGDARARVAGLRVLRSDLAGGAETLVAGPLPIPVDNGEFPVSLTNCSVPGSGAIRLRVVADLIGDPQGLAADVAVAIVGAASWSLHAVGAGAGPSTAVAAPGRAIGTPIAFGRLPGDLDGDGERTVLDVRRQLVQLGAAMPFADCDGDGLVTPVDVAATHAVLLGRTTLFTPPTSLLRGVWTTLRGVFAPGTVQATLGGQVLTIGCMTPREVVILVPNEAPAGTQELIVTVAGRVVQNALVQVQ